VPAIRREGTAEQHFNTATNTAGIATAILSSREYLFPPVGRLCI